ncbi:MAG: SCO family protein [Alphaproteobacteria bacterium]
MTKASTLLPQVRRLTLYLPLLIGLFVLAGSMGGCSKSCQVEGDNSVPIGGDFQLVDHTGAAVTEQDFRGKYQLIYFGFTYCPDICPAELQEMSAALDMLGSDADAIQPIFVSVDPERDDVEAMATYMQHFHPSFRGLTGTVEQVAAAASAYRVFYTKEPSPDAPEDYLINHSSFVYVMDCQGRYIRHFSMGTNAEEMAKGLKSLL